jgi:signal recognition particle receptor subunit beta/predicted  nucleic acid-binding Zn-ribbon protein
MVIYNAATRELTAKIVYYGPGLGGKTTNLQVLHDRLEPSTVGKLLNLSTHTDRTIYFDLLPVELGDIKGYKIRFQLATVPGQTAFNETRRVVLKGADGVVFVADSQWTMLPKNLEAWQNLKDNLKSNSVSFEGMPVVIQYNKRDLSDILSIEAMQEALGLSSFPFVEAVASAGRGVTETFKLISKLTFVDLLRRLQGRRPEEAGLPTGKEPKDDLQSWRQSLFQRAPAEPRRPRPLAAVPSPSEEAPFETGDPAPAENSSVVEGPFGGAREPVKEAAAPPPPAAPEPIEVVDEAEALSERSLIEEPIEIALGAPAVSPPAFPPPPPPAVAPPPPAAGIPAEALSALESRFEARLAEIAGRFDQAKADVARADAACNVLASRLEVAERQAGELRHELSDAQQTLEARAAGIEERARSDSREIARIAELSERAETAGARLDVHEQRLSDGFERLREQDQKFETLEKRLRGTEDDVGMALSELNERGEKLAQQVAAFAPALEGLQNAVEEKNSQGRREAEDIRSQLAPLLEAHGQRAAAEEKVLAEIDRLRERLADSLGDLAEQLRRAVRGL